MNNGDTHINPAHAQQEYQVRFDWGMTGLKTIAPGADVVVIIDVLSFSTAVELAVGHGLEVFPRAMSDAAAWAEAHDAVLAGHRGVSADPGDAGAGAAAHAAPATAAAITLSPASITADSAASVPNGRIVMSSPNGAALASALAEDDEMVVMAGLRNRRAVARWIRERQARKDGRFTVAIVAAGELRDDASLRFAVEDQLAAGALVDALADLGIDFHSPEAAVACASFVALQRAARQLIRASASGRELIEQGFGDDVDLATALDVSEIVPVLREFRFTA